MVVSPSDNVKVWSDVGRAGLQLLAVTVIGTVVTLVVRTVDNERSRTQRNEELRLEVLREILVADAQVKSVRRELRRARAAQGASRRV